MQCETLARPFTRNAPGFRMRPVHCDSNARMAEGSSPMIRRSAAFLLSCAVSSLLLVGACLRAEASTEYSKHFGALSQLSVAVAEAMPAEKYGFKPHPESMTFAELMS